MNIIDTRDLQKRLDELQGYKQALEDAREAVETLNADMGADSETLEALRNAESEFGEDEQTELAELESIASEVSDFRHGETMVDERDFIEYAEQLADDIGIIRPDNKWPLNHIDWEAAADELKADYTEVSYQGTTYLVRA